MTDLSGHTTLVTGASHGIGRATAVTLAAHGARVLVHYRTGAAEAERVVEAIARHGGRAEAVYADLSAADGAHRLATAVRSRADRLDILVANAGSYKAASIEDMSVEDFDGLFAVNVRAPFFLMQQLLPVMHQGGSIVFVSSLSAHAVFGAMAAYAASKGAVETLVKHVACALGSRGIRVNAIAPGLVAKDTEEPAQMNQRRDRALSMQAIQRLAQPEDIADVIAFLVSEDARWMTGQTVSVDGGSRL